jgi:26S proteasome regulatory subunit N8
LQSLKGLQQRLQDMAAYVAKVESGELPINHPILYNLQSIFNLLPDLSVEGLVKAMTVKTNDQMSMIYLSSLIRAIIALHNLISNKLENRDAEKEKVVVVKAALDKDGNEVSTAAANAGANEKKPAAGK